MTSNLVLTGARQVAEGTVACCIALLQQTEAQKNDGDSEPSRFDVAFVGSLHLQNHVALEQHFKTDLSEDGGSNPKRELHTYRKSFN